MYVVMKEKEQSMVEWKKILRKRTEKLYWMILNKVGAGWEKWRLGGKKIQPRKDSDRRRYVFQEASKE